MKFSKTLLLATSASSIVSVEAVKHHAAYYSYLKQNMKISAIEKVIQLLQDMSAKGQTELKKEQEQFKTYSLFCRDTSKDKAYQIQDGLDTIDDATTSIESGTAKAESLDKRIADNDAQIARNNQDLENAEAIRKKENSEFTKTSQDYSESLDAIERAIATLKAQNYDRKQAQEALLQVSVASKVDSSTKAKFSALAKQAPEANAYEFSSGGVIDMLEKLKDQFTEEHTSVQKAEATRRHNHDMLHQDLSNDTADRTEESEQLSVDSQKTKEDVAANKKLKADTEATLATDKEYKANLDATCAKKASDFERRTELRHQELEAIKKATEILQSDDVTGNGAKHGMIPAEATAFTQMKSLRTSHYYNFDTSKAQQFLQERSQSLHSTILSSLVMSINQLRSTDPHPFDKVLHLIEKLIAKLQNEAKEEAGQQAWCDKNLKVNEKDRKQFKKDVDSNSADVDKHGSLIAQKTKKLKDTETAISELSTALSEATTQRAAEKEENETTIAESKAAQTAIARALVVLQEFYGKAAEATSLLQKSKQEPEEEPVRNPGAPEIFDEAYTGMGAESGGVVGMLEVIQSDFARLEAETTAAEKNASDEYEKFREESERDLAVKKQSVQHLTEARNYDRQNHKEAQEALKNSEAQLKAAKETFEKLKPPCIRGPIDYEARVKAREAEIKSLREALEILEREKGE